MGNIPQSLSGDLYGVLCTLKSTVLTKKILGTRNLIKSWTIASTNTNSFNALLKKTAEKKFFVKKDEFSLSQQWSEREATSPNPADLNRRLISSYKISCCDNDKARNSSFFCFIVSRYFWVRLKIVFLRSFIASKALLAVQSIIMHLNAVRIKSAFEITFAWEQVAICMHSSLDRNTFLMDKGIEMMKYSPSLRRLECRGSIQISLSVALA